MSEQMLPSDNVTNLALVTSEGSKDLSIIFLVKSYTSGPILGLQKHAIREKSVRTYRHTSAAYIHR